MGDFVEFFIHLSTPSETSATMKQRIIRMNHQDMAEKFIRKALLIEEMVKIFKELHIQYRLKRASLPVIPNNNPQTQPPFWTATSSSG
ncbi:hypothetical protein SAY87_013166 [Trapa incisa]|uniref:Uncharacterized protein n=1 Tax=Trapa incisa TaxID=236973 RepID=A0AAN7QCX9_9MYRT|nr:hypothetical protein SAY87_013166 [Trapa incisa]